MTTELKKQSFQTGLSKISNIYFPMIQEQLENNSINMDDYAKQCVMNSISAINETLDTAGVKWSDKQLDQNNITEILLSIASLKLNPSASPNEVYFQLRNVKKTRYENGNKVEEWNKKIEMGIEGDGNDAILARYGRNVKQVMKFWEVRSEDSFSYPSFNGLEMTSPQWTPTGKGNVVKIVYPIIKHGDIVEYYIAEREDVVRNLIAHVNQNLMKETFGIAKSIYEANAQQKGKIQKKKQEILSKIDELGLDQALKDEEVQKHVSPAWKSLQSKESMIIRKMRNNVVKKIPKDFGNTLAELSYDKTSQYQEGEKPTNEVVENANSEVIDIEPNNEQPQEQPETVQEPKKEAQQEQPTKQNKDPQQSEKQENKEGKSNQEQSPMESIDISEDDVPF